jgi:hypothetical protein
MYRITEVSKLVQPCAKKIKDKFVSKCGAAILRNNMHIKYMEWKGKPSNPYMGLDSIKDHNCGMMC